MCVCVFGKYFFWPLFRVVMFSLFRCQCLRRSASVRLSVRSNRRLLLFLQPYPVSLDPNDEESLAEEAKGESIAEPCRLEDGRSSR